MADKQELTILQLINELRQYLYRNGLDDGIVRVQDTEGTYESPVLSVETPGDAFLIVKYPHGDCDAHTEEAVERERTRLMEEYRSGRAPR